MKIKEIKEGYIYLYYLFDVAYEIKLDRIAKIFGKKPEVSKLVYERLTPKYLQYKVPPLLLRLGKKELKAGDLRLNANTKAKLYEFGIVSIIFQIPFKGTFAQLAKLTSYLAENEDCQKLAKAEVEKLLQELKPFIEKPAPNLDFWEDYIIVSVKQLDSSVTAQELLSSASTDIAKLLKCERSRLSKIELDEALKYVLSYYEDELVAIDWQAAFIYDPKQSYDVLDVLEYALANLLELRTYDNVLDQAMERAYEDLSKRFKLSYSKILKNLTTVKLDVVEILDKISNSLKLIGDLYLAKVFRAAEKRFYLDELKQSIDEKLKTIESIYTLLFEKANNSILLFLEFIIVALFILDILVLLFPK